MDYKKLTFNELQVLKNFLNIKNLEACDYTIGGIYMWIDYYNYEYYYDSECFIIKTNVGYLYPLGNVKKGIELIKKETNTITVVPENELNKINYKEKEVLTDYKDYVYDAFDLAYLENHKYIKKRDQIKHFLTMYPNYSIELISKDNIKDILSEFDNLIHITDEISREEVKSTLMVLNNYDKFNFIGLLVKVDNKVIAFTIGEILFDTLQVHIEKANKEYKGIYQFINMEFSKYALENYNIKYINRQDDSGNTGLRQAKSSYYPIKYIKKYIVHL